MKWTLRSARHQHRWLHHPSHQIERNFHAFEPDFLTASVAKKLHLVKDAATCPCCAEMYKSNRLHRRAATRPGNTCDRDSDVSSGVFQRAFCHCARNRL